MDPKAALRMIALLAHYGENEFDDEYILTFIRALTTDETSRFRALTRTEKEVLFTEVAQYTRALGIINNILPIFTED